MNEKLRLAQCSRRQFLVASVALSGSAFSPTISIAQNVSPKRGGTLNVAVATDIKTLDPTFQVQFSERQPLYLIYNTLVGLSSDLSIIPELAEKWSLSADGKTLDLTFREGVRFHDGEAFDADVAKWNLDRRMDPKVASPSNQLLQQLIESVSVPNAQTISIALKGPAPTLLGLLAQREGFMISPKAVQKYGDDFGVNPVGTGPFKFQSWAQGSQITLVRNSDYWDQGKPYLDRIVFLETANPLVGVQRLITKEIDFIQALTPVETRSLEGRSDIRLDRNPGARWVSLEMRVDRPPFDKPQVRQALAMGLDRKRLVNILMAGKADIAEGPTPPGFWWFDPNLKSYDYDPEQAKKLLAEAGVGPNLQLTLSCRPLTEDQQLGALVQEQLKEIGVDIQIATVADYYSDLLRGVISFLPIRWSQRPDPDGLLTYLFDSSSPADTSHYKNPEVDSLLAQARNLTDQETRRPLYWRAQELITRDLPYIPLFFSVEYAAMNSDVNNFEWIPDGIPRFREVWKGS